MSGDVRWSSSGHPERSEELAGGRDVFLEGAQRMLTQATQVQVAERIGVRKEQGDGLGDGGPGLVT